MDGSGKEGPKRGEDGWSSSREKRGRMIIPQRGERTNGHPAERREDGWSSSREERTDGHPSEMKIRFK